MPLDDCQTFVSIISCRITKFLIYVSTAICAREYFPFLYKGIWNNGDFGDCPEPNGTTALVCIMHTSLCRMLLKKLSKCDATDMKLLPVNMKTGHKLQQVEHDSITLDLDRLRT